jgi:hypothetical protein
MLNIKCFVALGITYGANHGFDNQLSRMSCFINRAARPR